MTGRLETEARELKELLTRMNAILIKGWFYLSQEDAKELDNINTAIELIRSK